MTHSPLTCDVCIAKEAKTLSEYAKLFRGTGMFTDFKKSVNVGGITIVSEKMSQDGHTKLRRLKGGTEN